MTSKTFVNIDEAFNHGVHQGLKGALQDMQKMLKDHPEFLEQYIKIRLEYLEMIESFLKNRNE